MTFPRPIRRGTYKTLGLLVSATSGLITVSPVLGGDALTTLASFDVTNGEKPWAGVTLSGGMLYGTTLNGGANGDGVVFSVPATGGPPAALVTFNGSNGKNPYAGLTLAGNTLYGATSGGGTSGWGTIFSLPTAGGSPTLLVSFNGIDLAADPTSSPVLSGTTLYGPADAGIVYSVSASGGSPTTLATFNGANGQYPYAGLILSDKILYGTTAAGGGTTSAYGTVFSVPVTGGSPTDLAVFNGSNGWSPRSALVLAGSTLYGTTEFGGTSGGTNTAGYGEVFSLPLAGGSPTVLAPFNGSNGDIPWAGVTLSGNTLYGTTSAGGIGFNGSSGSGFGVIYSAPVSGGSPNVLAAFNGPNGANPLDSLILSGNTLYGTTSSGGANNNGTVFSLQLTDQGGVTVYTGLTTHFLSNVSTAIQVVPVPGVTIQATGIGVIDSGTSSSNRQLLVINSTGLSLAGSTGNWTGILDVRDNDLDLPGASLATVANQIAQGYANGRWNGAGGIVSSVAAADTTGLTALGIIQNNQGGTALYRTFDTREIGAYDVLVKYTYYGDATLDGKVDSADYSHIDAGFLSHGSLTGWFNGDFNYDGVINGSDYTLIDNAFNTQGAILADRLAYPTAQVAGIIDKTAVPEPASIGVLCSGSLYLLRRRPQKRSHVIANI